ncbi:hypothetical protein, partial [Ralstonia pseudosolanacearum]|uniref:hypothetical protein n=1 Tax=Ralstonia pseudosolanacearum TaxID=1310165 RepID=UPI001E548516
KQLHKVVITTQYEVSVRQRCGNQSQPHPILNKTHKTGFTREVSRVRWVTPWLALEPGQSLPF